VKIRFLDDAFEGREDWVPPSRLKVLWSGVKEWQARENRWEAVSIPSVGVDDTSELWAAELVFDLLKVDDALNLSYGRLAGVLCVSDASKAARILDITRSEFFADKLSFVDDDGTIVVPWSTTLELAKATASKHNEAVLREVAKRERKAAHQAVYGAVYGSRRAKPWYVTPEVCAEVDSRQIPTYALLRQWCGEAEVNRFDEISGLRAELLKVSRVAEQAISALEDAGLSKVAKSLKNDLGVRFDELRASRMSSSS
jgi:hypothetical protein